MASKLRLLDESEDLDITAVSSSPKMNGMCAPTVTHINVEMARTMKPMADLKSIWQLYKVLKRGRYDIVHSHTAKAGFIAAVAGRMAGAPLICHTYHGLPFFEGQNKARYCTYRLLEKLACRFRDHVFTQNKRDMRECVKLMGSTTKVSYEGNGVDIEQVRQSGDTQLIKALKDFPNKGIKLVLLNRLEPVKRVADFFKVVGELNEKGVEVSCVVAGFGILESELRATLTKMQLNTYINMVGYSNHPHGLIAAGDIVLLCSEKEGIPRSIMEAMVLEKPVVATDVLGTQELVVEGETGFLVPVGDTTKMAERIMLLAESPSLRRRMGQAGYEKARREFDERNVCAIVLDTYKRLLEKNQDPQV
ncbi:MAG: glycosyltransferase family 4 protein [Planctomycetota bacterium]